MNCHFLQNTPLFHGVRAEEIERMLPCLNASERAFEKDEIILRAGSATHQVGLVESGSVNVVVNFFWGGSHIFGHIKAGDVFAETYAALPEKELLCDVVAAESCKILFLDMRKLIGVCASACPYHTRLIHNILRISATKNLHLSNRMLHTAPKTIRERLLSYLSEQAMEHGSRHFSIPFSRQQLADYLGVDRSAMSAELSRMQKDGLIVYQKSDFTLLEKD